MEYKLKDKLVYTVGNIIQPGGLRVFWYIVNNTYYKLSFFFSFNVWPYEWLKYSLIGFEDILLFIYQTGKYSMVINTCSFNGTPFVVKVCWKILHVLMLSENQGGFRWIGFVFARKNKKLRWEIRKFVMYTVTATYDRQKYLYFFVSTQGYIS